MVTYVYRIIFLFINVPNFIIFHKNISNSRVIPGLSISALMSIPSIQIAINFSPNTFFRNIIASRMGKITNINNFVSKNAILLLRIDLENLSYRSSFFNKFSQQTILIFRIIANRRSSQ